MNQICPMVTLEPPFPKPNILLELITVMPGMSQPSVFHLDSDDTESGNDTEIDADTVADSEDVVSVCSVPSCNSDLHLLSDGSNSDLHLLSDYD